MSDSKFYAGKVALVTGGKQHRTHCGAGIRTRSASVVVADVSDEGDL
jgi:hypothetical protein